jgi:hypothetical protein
MRSSVFLFLLAISTPPIPGALLPPRSTVIVAAQLRHELSTPGGDAHQARKLRQLNALIDAFLVHQIETVPALNDGQLQAALRTLVADRDTDCNGSPLVYSTFATFSLTGTATSVFRRRSASTSSNSGTSMNRTSRSAYSEATIERLSAEH